MVERKGFIFVERYALINCAITLLTSAGTLSGTLGGKSSRRSSVDSLVCVTSLMVSIQVKKFSLLCLGSLSYFNFSMSNVYADLDNFLNNSLDKAVNDE